MTCELEYAEKYYDDGSSVMNQLRHISGFRDPVWFTSFASRRVIHYKIQRSGETWDRYRLVCDQDRSGGDCAKLLAEHAGLVAYGSNSQQPFTVPHMLFSTSSQLVVGLPSGLLRALTLGAFDLLPLIFVKFEFDAQDEMTVRLEAHADRWENYMADFNNVDVSWISVPMALQAALAYTALMNAGVRHPEN